MTTKGTTKVAKLNVLMKIAIAGAFLSLAVPFTLTHFVLPANPLSINEVMSTNLISSYFTIAFAVLLAAGAVKRFLDNR